MNAREWLRFVGAYLCGLALGFAIDWIFYDRLVEGPIRGTSMLFVAALTAVNVGLSGYRPPEPVLARRVLSVVAGTAALGLIVAVAVADGVGWRRGTAYACSTAIFVSLLQPAVFVWFARRRAAVPE